MKGTAKRYHNKNFNCAGGCAGREVILKKINFRIKSVIEEIVSSAAFVSEKTLSQSETAQDLFKMSEKMVWQANELMSTMEQFSIES